MPAGKRKSDPGPGVGGKPPTAKKPRNSFPTTTTASRAGHRKKAESEDSDEFRVRPKQRGSTKVKAERIAEGASNEEGKDDQELSTDEEEERSQDEKHVGEGKGKALPPSSPPRSSPPLSLFLQDVLDKVESKRKQDKADDHKFDEYKLEVEAAYNGAEDDLEQILENTSRNARSKIVSGVFTDFDKKLEMELQHHQHYTTNKNERDISAFSALQVTYVKFLNTHYPLPNLLKDALTTYERRPLTMHELVQAFEIKQKIELEKVHAKVERDLDARNLIRASRKMLRHARRE